MRLPPVPPAKTDKPPTITGSPPVPPAKVSELIPVSYPHLRAHET